EHGVADDVDAADVCAAARGSDSRREHAHRRRLSGPVRAQQSEHLTALDLKGDRVYSVHGRPRVALHELAYLDCGVGHFSPPPFSSAGASAADSSARILTPRTKWSRASGSSRASVRCTRAIRSSARRWSRRRCGAGTLTIVRRRSWSSSRRSTSPTRLRPFTGRLTVAGASPDHF